MRFDLISPIRALKAALLACIALVVAASSLAAQTDVIRGRVTNPEGLPLTGVRITATSIPGNVTRETRTSDKGLYQIAFPGGTGDYMMGFALIGYVFRQFEIKRLADEEVLIADARLTVIQLDTVAVELSDDTQHLAAVNTVLDADQDSEGRALLNEIVAGLESGELEPTAGAIEPLADKLRA